QNERGGGNEREPRRRQCSLPTHRVGERAAWDLRRHRRQPTDGERKPDVLFRPAEIGQVECEERAEAQLNIGEKKIRPIESAPAAIRYFPISKLAPVAMLRDDPPRAGMETEDVLENSGAPPGLLGLVARFRTTLSCLGSSTHCSCNSPLRLPPLALVSGGSGSGRAIFAGVLCFVARLDVADVLGKSLQRGAQPSLVLSLLLVLGLMHVRNSRHLGNECFDDLIDGFMDGTLFAVLGVCSPRSLSRLAGPCNAKTTCQWALSSPAPNGPTGGLERSCNFRPAAALPDAVIRASEP